MNEEDWAAIPRVLQLDQAYRRSMLGSSGLTIEADLPMDTLTMKRNSQDKLKEKKEEELSYQGDEFESSRMGISSETSVV